MPTSRNRMLAVAAIIVLMVPALLIAPVATAQDTVPTAPTVAFDPIPSLRQRLFLRFDNVGDDASGEPDCGSADARALRLTPAEQVTSGTGRGACGFPAAALGQEVPNSQIEFVAPTSIQPNRAISFTGNNSFLYRHEGPVPSGISIEVVVVSGGTTVAGGFLTGNDDNTSFTVPLQLRNQGALTGRVQLAANQAFLVRLAARTVDDAGNPLGQALPTGSVLWTLDDTNTYLEMRADDAVRAAIWVTDETNAVRDVFAPIANDSQLPTERNRRMVGFFALQSAFGIDDARRGEAPAFSLVHQGRQREIATGGGTILTGVYNATASIDANGTAVWTFPADTLVYRGFPSGEYTLHVQKAHHQGDPITRAVDKRVLITSQAVRLAPFSDPRVPSLTESQAHTVPAGASTTYLLTIHNTGAANDTFTLNLTAPNAPGGWGATIGGPDVLQRRVTVPSGETRLIAITVNAPAGARDGEQVIHLVNATSTLDPGARSTDITLVTTVGNVVTRGVGIVFLTPDLGVDPGESRDFPVYAWNRGTRAANISLEARGSAGSGWEADLLLGSVPVGRLILSNVQPGAIAEATLRVRAPSGQSSPTHNVVLNATSQDATGIATERVVQFALRTVTGVRVDVFNAVGSRGHDIEIVDAQAVVRDVDGNVQGPSPRCAVPSGSQASVDCVDDGVEGTWFRIWVTNTGKVTDTFELSGSSFDEASAGSSCTDTAFPGTSGNPMTGNFSFYHRRPSGAIEPLPLIPDLPAGTTAEVYVFIPVDRFRDVCLDSEEGVDFYRFIVQARGRTTNVIGRAPVEAFARQTDTGAGQARPTSGYLEAVERDGNYTARTPYVNISQAAKRTITGAVPVGQNITYKVRMTNSAGWAAFQNAQGRVVAPDMHVQVVGLDRTTGWNVSIRPVLETNNDIIRNPYSDEYYLKNTAPGTNRREAWFDQELEVVVQAPGVGNLTALAGDQFQFTLVAKNNFTNQGSELYIKTVIAEFADVRLSSDQARGFAHPGEAGAFLLYVNNDGSAASSVTLTASMNRDNTPNAAQWRVEPGEQRFSLDAFKNRTIALLVTPPAGAAQGTVGEVLVNLTYVREATTNTTEQRQIRLTTEVVAPGSLQLTPGPTDAVIAPGGFANFTMTLRNSGSLALPYRMVATPIPNWTTTLSPAEGTINPGESKTVVLVLKAPNDVVNNAAFSSIVRVQEVNAANNFDTAVFSVSIVGGRAIPTLDVTNFVKRVDRDGVQNFEVRVKNVGTRADRIPLSASVTADRWSAVVQNARGDNITSVQLGPNELVTVNVSVRAPRDVPEGFATPVELRAESPDGLQTAKATLQAEIHDYGVDLTVLPSSKDALPGVATEFTLRIKNTGNDNDTLNLSANLVELPEWSIQLAQEEVRLEPNQETEVRATIRSPTDPLPTPRAYTFPFWAGTRGGQAVNITKNDTMAAVLTIPNFRSLDVDRDDQLEIVIDQDKRATNGFEVFREVFPEGLQTLVVSQSLKDGRMRFFLDVPEEGSSGDGIADVWFDPETVYAYEILHHPDLNQDGTPDYLLDTDRDGKIDQAYDTVTERYWSVVEIKAYGDERIQYLVDITGDGRPDRYFDPAGNDGNGLVTRTQTNVDVGRDFIGIDLDDDEDLDKYYNTNTEDLSDATVANFGDFALKYWYFFLAFVALVVLTIVAVVRRRRA